MPNPPLPLGSTLEHWLDRLDAEGFRVGIRERLLVQAFLTRLAARGELPASRTDALKLLAPLVCTSPDSQRRYGALLREFLAAQPGPRRLGLHRPAPRPQEATGGERPAWPRRAILALLAVLLSAALARVLWPETTPVMNDQAAGPGAGALQGRDTPPLPKLAAAPARPSGRVAAAWGVASLSALLLAWAGLRRLRRDLYLQGVRSDAQIEEHVLRDPHGTVPETPPGPLRVAARGLRQRVAGEREVLDLAATLAATVRAAGAFSPRWRLLQHTPEYLALIDRRHPHDHLAAYADALLAALAEHGVTVQAYSFEGSPDHGCWRLRAGAGAFDRSSMAELAARYAGHRLLVFAGAEALLDPLDQRPRTWGRSLQPLRQRAWFSPMPLASWGADEAALDAQGFLVLPLPAEALTTLAGWFSSGDLSLSAGPDWPLAYPPLLEHAGVAWVVRQTAPPAEILAELRYQLRAYLGPRRHAWLCACALFPALSPGLTLTMGQELGLDARERSLGLAALGALPWFRHGRMPAWLRQALVAELGADDAERVRQVIQTRLAGALLGPTASPQQAPELARIATRRALWAWLVRGRGPARDVVLVDFLQRGAAARLAQVLPEALRRRLFNNGLAQQGARPAALAGLGLVLAAALAVALIPDQVPLPKEYPQPPARTEQATPATSATPATPASTGQAPESPPEETNTLRLPSVVGLPADQAAARLVRLGFKVVRREQPGNTKAPSGSVLGQDPAGNSQVPAGSRVTLRVASPAPERSGWCCLAPSPTAQSQPAASLETLYEKDCLGRGGRFFTDETQARKNCTPATPRQMPPPAGWEGVDVYEVQGLLAKAGLYTGPVDGTVRNELIKALMLFQEKNRQAPDGLPGPRTLSLLRGERQAPAAPGSLRMQN